MIQNRQEWEHTIQTVAKMYGVRDRSKAETQGDLGTQEDEVLGVVFAIRKLERELADYLRTHPLTDDEYPEIREAIARRHEESFITPLLSQTPEKVSL